MNDIIRNCDHFNDHLLAYMERMYARPRAPNRIAQLQAADRN